MTMAPPGGDHWRGECLRANLVPAKQIPAPGHSVPPEHRPPPRAEEIISPSARAAGWRDDVPSGASTARSQSLGSLGFHKRSGVYGELVKEHRRKEEELASTAAARSQSESAIAAEAARVQEQMSWTAPSFRTRPGINGEFYPHAIHNRGNMQLTHMGVLCQSIDPMKNTMYKCPMYEAPPCRFERNATYKGSVPRTPKAASKWRSQEEWNKTGPRSGNEAFKVNHVRPSRFGSQGNVCQGIVEVHPPSIFMSTKQSQNGALITPTRRQLG